MMANFGSGPSGAVKDGHGAGCANLVLRERRKGSGAIGSNHCLVSWLVSWRL